jgi:hypothetical protein
MSSVNIYGKSPTLGNEYHVFVDEAYDERFFVLAIVWVKKINEVKRLKSNASNKNEKSRYKFHFRDDPEKIKNVFMEEILNSLINAGVIIFNNQPKSCKEYAEYYVVEVVRVLPISNSIITIYVKGLKNWISKGCDPLAEAVKVGIPNGNAVKLYSRANVREGIEVADYIASSYRKCMHDKEDLCDKLESKLKFIYRR